MLKNFSYLMDASGQWYVSPAYDLTFSSGPGGEHSSTVMGEGKSPGQERLLVLAQCVQLSATKALSIIDEVKHAVNQWPLFAKEAGLDLKTQQAIGSMLIRQKLM